jgi:hypothetical protein
MQCKILHIMNDLISFPAVSIGIMASKISKISARLEVMGNSTKGYFLKHPVNQIIFLSKEAYRGPYTITLGDPGIVIDLAIEEAWIEPGRLILNQKYMVDFQKCNPWQPDDPPNTMGMHPSATGILKISELAEFAQKTDEPVRLLNNIFLNGRNTEEPDEHWMPVINAIRRHNFLNLIENLRGVVGYGRGLTPSGDDFILGILLGLARYNDFIQLSVKDRDEIDPIIRFASKKTTLISANLLSGARNGLADERLIQAFDGYMFGSLDGQHIYDILSTWGNSSGLDAFTGWALLLYCLGKI